MKKLIKYILLVLAVVALDQWTKILVLKHIPLYGQVDFWPGVLSFTYTQNTGAAWSMLEGQRWLFVAVFAVLTALLLLEHFKFHLPLTALERWLIAAVYAGGLGNVIDRVRLGYVVDMIKTEFMDFPVFNVADCFICCGCIALIILLFFNKEFWKEEKHGSTNECGSGGGETGCLSDQDCGGADQSESPDGDRGGSCDPAGEESQEER